MAIMTQYSNAPRRAVRFVRSHSKSIMGLGLGLAFLLAGIVLFFMATLQVPDLTSLSTRRIEQSVKIYDRTGTVMLYDLSKNSQRTIVPLTAISPNIQNATIAIEDPNFYQHRGVEFTAMLRALFVNVSSLGYTQGGSTITQQVVKGSILTSDKTIARKLKEIVLSLKLERVLTKQQILELYLNQVPYGGNVYGAEEASQVFFGKHASDVSVAEAAYLAAVLPAPSRLSPYGSHKKELDARKNLVLDKMFEHGYVTAQERDAAKQEVVTFQPQRTTSIAAPHFVFYIQQYLENKYGEDALLHGGWTVISTLDADLQAKAEEVVQAHAAENEKSFNATNAGMVGLDPKTGQILVMVGSRNYFDTHIDGNFNIALAKRQPGSAFKPFAYAEAFQRGYTPDTVLFDVPTQFSTNCSPYTYTSANGCYAPVNYDGNFRGPMTLRNALAQSINVPAVKVLYLAGIGDTLRLAKAMGITTLGNANQYGLTLVLGGGEVTLLDMADAYGTFAQNGMYYPPVSILTVKDASGAVIEDNTQSSGTQVLAPDIAQKINDILSDPVAKAPLGENDLLTFPGHDVAVKTGTTNDYKDAWTIGYTPNLVFGIWAGNNDNTPMVKKVSGFIVGPMWHEFMAYALQKLPNESFVRSDIGTTASKPVLRGDWQTPGSDGKIHEILYWVQKSNPTGPIPSNPASDPQFSYWDIPVAAWAASHNITPSTPSTTTSSTTAQ